MRHGLWLGGGRGGGREKGRGSSRIGGGGSDGEGGGNDGGDGGGSGGGGDGGGVVVGRKGVQVSGLSDGTETLLLLLWRVWGRQ